jgi:hypothetical protein
MGAVGDAASIGCVDGVEGMEGADALAGWVAAAGLERVTLPATVARTTSNARMTARPAVVRTAGLARMARAAGTGREASRRDGRGVLRLAGGTGGL